jgi:hypothetical protein
MTAAQSTIATRIPARLTEPGSGIHMTPAAIGVAAAAYVAGACLGAYWGPGRFGAALRAAVEEGRARRLSSRSFGAPERNPADG